MDIERICLHEAATLARRDKKYWLLLAHMYGKSVLNPKAAKLLRAAYFFCRHIDDVLDGDRTITNDPKGYVEEIRNAMHGAHSNNEIIKLYQYVMQELEKQQRTETTREDFERVITAMVFDYERSHKVQFLTQNQLEQYYDNTFTPVLNISLMIAESQFRGQNIPELSQCMGHLYSIRDLKRDLDIGIVNIPYEEIKKARVDIQDDISYKNLKRNTRLSQWKDDEVSIYGTKVRTWKKEARKKIDREAQRVCDPLIIGMQSFCKRYWKESTYK